jgi:glycosyltransferase involved in cell wall biosynthesis
MTILSQTHRTADHNRVAVREPGAGLAVLQIVPALDTGGAERTTIDIARALTREGHSALVVSEGGRLQDELRSAGAELIHLPVASKNPRTMFANAAAIARIIRERNVSLVHARSRAPAWSALIAARRTGVPFVTTYHGIYNANGPLKRFYNSVMVRGDAVIANSEGTSEHIRATYGNTPKRVVVIPRGIDLDAFDPAKVPPERVREMRAQWRLAEDNRVILLPGRLTRWKGQLVLLRALRLLKESGRLPADVRAVLVGDPQRRQEYVYELMAAISDGGLSHVVEISYHIADMPAVYLASHIVVSPSTDPEGFGRVPPEAAAMGRPVIATDHGGARETVLAGETGLLVKPGDPGALADALADLLGRPPAELLEMGRKGRHLVAERYTVERMCADTLALYRDLTGV